MSAQVSSGGGEELDHKEDLKQRGAGDLLHSKGHRRTPGAPGPEKGSCVLGAVISSL